jgi:hypothetical protein
VVLQGFASAVTDLGTQGAVHVQLEANAPGPAGNTIRLVVSESNHGDASGPAVTVSGSTINVDINTNAANPTTAQQLVDAINADAAAAALVTATIVRGTATADLTATDPGGYSPVPLTTAIPVAYQLDGSQLTLDYLPDQNGRAVLVLTATDQTLTSVSDTVTITVVPVNDAPTFQPGANPVTVNEDAGLRSVDNWATAMLPGPVAAADESIQALEFVVTVLSTGTLTAADFTVQPAIDSLTGTLTFQIAPNANGEAHVEVALRDDGGTANGGVDTSAPHTLTITVRPINDPPVLTVPVSLQSTDEDVSLTFSSAGGNGVSVFDQDAAEAAVEELRVTLSVLQGSLTLSTTVGLAFDTGDGAADPSMTFRGSQAAINAALNGLQYLPRLDYNGTDRLVVTVNDLGNHGWNPLNPAVWSTGVDVSRTISITVRPVNDPPTVVVPSTSYTVFEDTNLPLPGVVVGDARDAAYAPVTLRVTLTALYGTITVNTNVTNGVTFGGVANNGTKSVSLTGTPAAINTTLAHATGVVYRGLLNYNNFTVDGTSDPNERLVVAVNDLGNVGSGGALEAKQTVTISVLQANDAPVITSPGPQILNEDDPNFYIPLIVTDVDADESPVDPKQAVTVVLRLTDNAGNPLTTVGTLTVRTDVPNGLDPASGTGNGTLAGNGTAQVTITGSPVKITETLRDATGLHFLPQLNWNGSLRLVASVEDHGNSGGGASLSHTVTIPIVVNAVNDPPVVTVPTGPHMLDEGLGQSLPIYGIGVTDVDAADTDPGYIIVTLSIPANQGSLAVVPGAVGGVPSNRISNNGTRAITLTGTPAEINQTLSLPRGVTYTVPDGNFNNNRVGGDVILTVHADDQGRTGSGSITTDTETLAITVTPVNDLPVITVPGLQTLNEGPGASRAIAGISVQDVDFEELGPADMTVNLSIPLAQGTLSVATGVVGGVTNIAGNGTNSITLIGRIAQINATLAAAMGVTYTVPNGDFNSLNNNGSVLLTVATNDQGRTGNEPNGVPVSAVVPIVVNPINDDPVITAPAPTQATEIVVVEDVPVVFSAGNNTLIAVSDVDLAESSDNSMNVTIAANNGTFKLSTTAGLISHSGDGTGSVTFRGNQAAVNAALAGATFTPRQDFNGRTTLVITVNDRGNTGGGPSQGGVNVVRVVNLRFTAVNDFPTIVVNPTTLDTTEDVVGGLNVRAVQVFDPDVTETPGGELLVTLRVNQGTLTVRDNLGLAFLKPGDISGNGTGTVILAATPDEINNTLAAVGGLIYQPNPQFAGQDILRVDANDQGLSGAGGVGLDQNSLTINVASVNDPPQLTVPTARNMQEDGILYLPGISVSDEDAGANVIQVTLTATKGTLWVSTGIAGGLVGAQVQGSDTITVTLLAPMAAINATLADPNGLRYTPFPNANGVEQLVVVANDLGHSGGTNQPETATKTVQITIAAVNDAPQIRQVRVFVDLDRLDRRERDLGITVTDVDALEGTGQVRVTLTVANGTLTVSTRVASRRGHE